MLPCEKTKIYKGPASSGGRHSRLVSQVEIVAYFQALSEQRWEHAVLTALSPGGSAWPLVAGAWALAYHATRAALGDRWRRATLRTRDRLTYRYPGSHPALVAAARLADSGRLRILPVRPVDALFLRTGPVYILTQTLQHPVTQRYLEWAMVLSGGRLSEGTILGMAPPPRSSGDARFLDEQIRMVLLDLACGFWEELSRTGGGGCSRRRGERRTRPSGIWQV